MISNRSVPTNAAFSRREKEGAVPCASITESPDGDFRRPNLGALRNEENESTLPGPLDTFPHPHP